MRRLSNTLNSKQQQILEYITQSLREEYRCPTVREICKHVGLSSTSSVQNHLDRLEVLGYITRDTNKNRAITVNAMKKNDVEASEDHTVTSSEPFEFLAQQLKQVPLIGTVQAGTPITAVENQESALTLPISLVGNTECFLLRVQGESMIDIGIYEGDMLIVRHQPTANNGDIVVARIDDEATVKRFFKEKDHIRLQPENDSFEPIIVKDCVIEGKVIGLIRENLH